MLLAQTFNSFKWSYKYVMWYISLRDSWHLSFIFIKSAEVKLYVFFILVIYGEFKPTELVT